MAGLVGYESSDEEEEEVQQAAEAQKPQPDEGNSARKDETEPDLTSHHANGTHAAPSPQSTAESAPSEGPKLGPSLPPPPSDAAQIGPSLPSGAAAYAYPTDFEQQDDPTQQEEGSPVRPLSPYSAERAAIRDLTLPTVPNLAIPPSPPGSPPPALSAKFEQFLDLKRRKSTHFNAKIAQSTALRNPSLMDKLLGFVGVEAGFDKADGTAQYATTLPAELWDPRGFPDWAYRVPLGRAQTKERLERQRQPGEPVGFVKATATGTGTGIGEETEKFSGEQQQQQQVQVRKAKEQQGGSSRTGTPGSVTGKRKSREDQDGHIRLSHNKHDNGDWW